MYCQISNDQIVNIAECDAEWAAQNGYVWIDPPIDMWWVKIDGVWRDKTLEAKKAEMQFLGQTRANDLRHHYVNDVGVWGNLTEAQQKIVMDIIDFCDNITEQDGYPWIEIPDKTF